MAAVARLIALVLALWALSLGAWADTVPATSAGTQYRGVYYSTGGVALYYGDWLSSESAARLQAVNWGTAQFCGASVAPGGGCTEGGTPGTATWAVCRYGPGYASACANPVPGDGKSGSTGAETRAAPATCPPNSTGPDGSGNCTCAANHVAKNGMCVANCPPQGTRNPGPMTTLGPALVVCSGGCGYAPRVSGSTGDGYYQNWGLIATGAACSQGLPPGMTSSNAQEPGATPSAPGTAPPTPCSVGMCPGTVNGAQVCVACGKTNATGPSTSASGVGNGASGPTGGQTTGSTSTTTCTGDSCTTTNITNITNVGSGGSAACPAGQTSCTTTETKTQNKGDFCAQNPGDPNCSNEKSNFGGSCTGGFTCKGDAVQCAMAREQHQFNCRFTDDTQDTPKAGYAAMSGEALPSDHPGNDKNVSKVSLGSSIDQTDLLRGSCISDKSVEVMGTTVVIPLSKVCEPIQWLRRVLIAMALVHAAFLVVRAF